MANHPTTLSGPHYFTTDVDDDSSDDDSAVFVASGNTHNVRVTSPCVRKATPAKARAADTLRKSSANHLDDDSTDAPPSEDESVADTIVSSTSSTTNTTVGVDRRSDNADEEEPISILLQPGGSERKHVRLRWHRREYKTYTFVHHEPLGSSTPSRSRKVLSEELLAHRAYKAGCRKRWSLFYQMRAIAHAKVLALALGHCDDTKWPVVWYENDCYVMHPPQSGEIDSQFVGNHDHTPYIFCDRSDGIRTLHATWHTFWHVGTVPDVSTITAASSSTVHSSCPPLPLFDVQCRFKADNINANNPKGKVGKGESSAAVPPVHSVENKSKADDINANSSKGNVGEDESSVAVPPVHSVEVTTNGANAVQSKTVMPANAKHSSQDMQTNQNAVAVTSGLMDTGSPLDIVDQSAVPHLHHHIESCQPCVLETANGETIANKLINLHQGKLGEHISPYVLDSSPNVLALGRRIVDQGYDLWWPGYSLTPWIRHPITKEIIYLRVEDYCPYLDDDGTTIPSTLYDVSYVCCAIAPKAATISIAAPAHAPKVAGGVQPAGGDDNININKKNCDEDGSSGAVPPVRAVEPSPPPEQLEEKRDTACASNAPGIKSNRDEDQNQVGFNFTGMSDLSTPHFNSEDYKIINIKRDKTGRAYRCNSHGIRKYIEPVCESSRSCPPGYPKDAWQMLSKREKRDVKRDLAELESDTAKAQQQIAAIRQQATSVAATHLRDGVPFASGKLHPDDDEVDVDARPTTQMTASAALALLPEIAETMMSSPSFDPTIKQLLTQTLPRLREDIRRSSNGGSNAR